MGAPANLFGLQSTFARHLNKLHISTKQVYYVNFQIRVYQVVGSYQLQVRIKTLQQYSFSGKDHFTWSVRNGQICDI